MIPPKTQIFRQPVADRPPDSATQPCLGAHWGCGSSRRGECQRRSPTLPQAIFVAGSLSNNFPSAGNAGLTWHQSFNATYYRPLGGADHKYIYIYIECIWVVQYLQICFATTYMGIYIYIHIYLYIYLYIHVNCIFLYINLSSQKDTCSLTINNMYMHNPRLHIHCTHS